MIIIISDINQSHRKKGYYIKDNQIIFLFDEKLYHETQLQDVTVENVAVKGSITAWKSNWELKKISDHLWIQKKKFSKVKIPGNSGQPEFRFVINNQYYLDAYSELSLKYKFYDAHNGGYKNVIIFDQSKAEKIQKINQQIKEYKKNYKSDYELANFREVSLGNIASKILYRSYHPFIKSKADHPLEEKRLTAVRKLIKKHDITSIINLSDTEEEIPKLLPSYLKLIDKKNLFFPNKEHQYDIYYYTADSNDFAILLRRIINFIIKHPTPILLHCRIGTDRTGVITAVLAAFMGASWENIAADYKRSNETGIKEYRDEKLLEYGFKGLLGADFKEGNLQQQITHYFKERLNLTDEKIKQLENKLEQKK